MAEHQETTKQAHLDIAVDSESTVQLQKDILALEIIIIMYVDMCVHTTFVTGCPAENLDQVWRRICWTQSRTWSGRRSSGLGLVV